MISVLPMEDSTGSVHDLAHIPTKNRLAYCLTKASAKAYNLITGVQTGNLLDVDFTLILEPSWSTRPSCQPGAKHFCTQGRRKSSS